MRTKNPIAKTTSPNPVSGHLKTVCGARLLPLFLLLLSVWTAKAYQSGDFS